jgi:hypothetical protein
MWPPVQTGGLFCISPSAENKISHRQALQNGKDPVKNTPLQRN